MRVLNPWKLLAPGGLVGGCHTSEGRIKLLIGPLSLAVSLWMKARGKTDLSSQGGTKHLPDI